MMESFLSILPRGFFGLNNTMEGVVPVRGEGIATPTANRVLAEDIGRKRSRGYEGLVPFRWNTVHTLPFMRTTQCTKTNTEHELDSEDCQLSRPVKRIKCDTSSKVVSPIASECPPTLVPEEKLETPNKKKSPLELLPDDVLAHCLSFVSGTEDRFALQCTSKQFQKLSNSDEMLIGIEVGGDRSTGKNGIIRDNDTPDSAADKLTPFAVAGNLEALYM